MGKRKKGNIGLRGFLKELLIMWCEHIIANYKQYYITPPSMREIVHYAKCRACINEIRRQGWIVGFAESNGRVVEVRFYNAKLIDYVR